VCAADVNGDGTLDAIGAGESGDEIVWWENSDGLGEVWIRHEVSINANDPRSVYFADIDLDDDVDILGACYGAAGGSAIMWWENSDGVGTSWIEHTIRMLGGAHSVFSADMDCDGDPDVIGAGQYSDRITWWENNIGGSGVWFQHFIAIGFDGARSVHVADMDNDSDLDVTGVGSNTNMVAVRILYLHPMYLVLVFLR